MKHIAAYVLLLLSGNEAPTAEQVTEALTSIGTEVDEAKLAALFADLEGKNIHELLAKGDNDLKSVVGVSSGGGSSSAAAAAPAAAAAAPAAPEKPKEEEVDALDGGMDMFGGGGGGGGGY